MGREKDYPLSDELIDNAIDLLERVNRLLKEIGVVATVSSGYRPGSYNVKANGSKRSAHSICKAVDLVDINSCISSKITENLLVKHDLYMENKKYCPGWIHLQTRPTKNRIFVPY